MTSFLLNLRSRVLLIHGEERVQTSSKQLILIWDSISSSKVHYHIIHQGKSLTTHTLKLETVFSNYHRNGGTSNTLDCFAHDWTTLAQSGTHAIIFCDWTAQV